MKWIRTTNGDKVHAVMHRHDNKTVCGIALEHAGSIVIAGWDDRCQNCDHEWRRRGKANRPKGRDQPVDPRNVYRPRFTFRDWEDVP
jgi:hypothetical protein